MRFLVDGSAAREAGALTQHEGLLPALDALLDDDRCTLLASPVLARRLGGALSRIEIEVVDVARGIRRFTSLNLGVRRRMARLRPAAVLCGQYAPAAAPAPYVLRMTDAHLLEPRELKRLLPFYSPEQRAAWRIKAAAFRRSVDRAGAIVCATHAVEDQLFAAFPTMDRARVFTAHYGPSPLLRVEALHPGGGGTRLLTMHASPRKNVETILDALARPELAGWSLTVMADLDHPRDRYTRFLAARVRELGLEGRVRSAGFIHDRDRLVRCMLDHDIFVTPSRIESWSHTVVEALGMGMPVIASDIACHREVTEEAAWLVPCDGAAAIAASALEIAAGGARIRDRIERGRHVVAAYSWTDYAAGALAALRYAAGAR